MAICWKRLNDHGKNWRHVYKTLILFDYLVKAGSEQIVQELMEHIYQIDSLDKFQHIDDYGRDQGYNVRVKAKELSSLLRDPERVIELRTHVRQTGRVVYCDHRTILAGGPQNDVRINQSNFSSAPRANTAQRGQNLTREEEEQLRLAMELSLKEEEDRQARQRSSSTNTSRSGSSTGRTTPTAKPKGTLYAEELALLQRLGPEEYEKQLLQASSTKERATPDSGSDSDVALAMQLSNSMGERVQAQGWQRMRRLWNSSNCGVLLCLVLRLMCEGRVTYDTIEPIFGRKEIDLDSERSSLLQWLMQNYGRYRPIMESVVNEAKIAFPNETSQQTAFQNYIQQMKTSRNFFSISELAAGAYRDNYVLVIIHQNADTGDAELQGMISPPSATRVFYALFVDPAHFDILEPKPALEWEGNNIFCDAPRELQQSLIEVHRRQVQEQASVPSGNFSPVPTPSPMPPLQPIQPSIATPPMRSDWYNNTSPNSAPMGTSASTLTGSDYWPGTSTPMRSTSFSSANAGAMGRPAAATADLWSQPPPAFNKPRMLFSCSSRVRLLTRNSAV